MTVRVDVLERHVVALPDADLERLTVAARSGSAALFSLRSSTGSTAVRAACVAIQSAAIERPYLEIAGVIDGLRRARLRDRTRVELVWSGPPSEVTTHRLTSATVADLIDEAQRSVVLVSYAMHSEKTVGAALARAVDRSVSITFLAERSADNPQFAGYSLPFPGVPSVRLAWPASRREAGSALHAKILAIDEEVVLIGSANLTQSAMERNLECGVVLRSHSTAKAVVDHLNSLRRCGVLVSVRS